MTQAMEVERFNWFSLLSDETQRAEWIEHKIRWRDVASDGVLETALSHIDAASREKIVSQLRSRQIAVAEFCVSAAEAVLRAIRDFDPDPSVTLADVEQEDDVVDSVRTAAMDIASLWHHTPQRSRG